MVKNPSANAVNTGSNPGLGRSPGEGIVNPPQYSCLENPTDRGALAVKNLPAMRETWVQSLGREYPLEKEMVTHSGILAWEIPMTEEPGELQSTGSQKSQT